jgi:hypothetical protein
VKIYKAITPFYLEASTKDGWTLEQTLPTSRYDKVQCDTPLAVAGYDGNSSGNYGSAGTVQHTYREELVQVNEPIFIMSKDSEAISREEEIAKQLREAQDKLKLADERHKLNERDMGLLNTKASSLEETRTVLQAQLAGEQTTRRQMENHLAKIRTAIGTVRYDEILGS